MAGHNNFDKLRDKMSSKQKAAVKERVEVLKNEMLLSELRKQSGMTQVELAKILGISQPTLSSQENRTDMEIGTLQRMIEAIGGRLEIRAVMPNGIIPLKQFKQESASK